MKNGSPEGLEMVIKDIGNLPNAYGTRKFDDEVCKIYWKALQH